MGHLSKLIRQRLQATANQGESHPDPNLLAAFADQALGKTERVHVLEHLARCAGCREIVSLATSDYEADGGLTPAPGSGWLRGPVLRWGALAASVAVVTVAVTLPRLSRHPSLVPTPPSAAQTDAKGNAPEARMEEPREKLAASASSDKKREVDFAAKQAKRPEFSRRMNPGRVPTPFSEADYSKQPAAQATVPAAPPLLAKAVDADQSELARKKEQRNDLQVNAANEIVTLQAKAAPAELEMTPGKAKDAPSKTRDSQAGLVSNGAQAQTVAGASSSELAHATSIKNDDLRRREKLPRWTLSSDGTLERSLDAGKTWATIPVAGNSAFRALAAVGADIWVGGSAGSLYRSTDAGEHWLKIKPAAGGKVLTADIIGVEFTDSNHGKLTTADEQIWITADAGQTWQIN